MKKQTKEPKTAPAAPEAPETVVIKKHENNTHVRWRCVLCGGYTEKQDYLYELPGDHSAIVCDDCATQPERISDRIREHTRSLEQHVADLDAWAKLRYVTDQRLREQNSNRLVPEGLTYGERIEAQLAGNA